MNKILFIGAGNMAYAIACGISNAKLVNDENIFLFDKNPEQLSKFPSTFSKSDDLNEAISMSDYVVVLSKGPSIVKNIYKIELDKKGIPTENRKDNKFNYYFDLIYKELDNIV